MTSEKKSILFVCSHNAFRSQIAEGYMRARHGRSYEAYSAGTDPTELDPRAVPLMAEIGIDISMQKAKPLMDFFDKEIDIAVTVCDGASGACPMVPGAGVVFHQSFPEQGSCSDGEEQCMDHLRRVRDAIITWIDQTFE
ncbi:MAG TPA: arsenate reductase ArsC [Methanospirillum sp.]|nr:arsenate reductase ArsC [Methanospirillum sp.]